MSNALLSAVSGMNAHQKMIDVAGNNLANLNTTAFKSSRVTFSDLLSETVREASQPTATVGGTNPQQIGSGVRLATVDRNLSQGSLINTGEALDMAIEGAGFFVLNDGQQDVYTRAGSFAVDSEYYLVDPATGYRVQRVGSEGIADGFQSATNNAIRIPYDVALPAKETTQAIFSGNLSANESSISTQTLGSGTDFSIGGAVASAESLLSATDQSGGTLVDGDIIDVTVWKRDGTEVTGSVTVDKAVTKLQDILDKIEALMGDECEASVTNGEIHVADKVAGYSKMDVNLAMHAGATGNLELPHHFKILSAGGLASKSTNIELFDSQGNSHIMSASFVKRDDNLWDMVVTSVTGETILHDRRIEGISFNANGSYGGMNSTINDAGTLQLGFAYDGYATKTIAADMGTVGEFNGLSQFGGASTAAPSGQDGYASGVLSSMSVNREGVLVGVFTNGVRKDVAAIKVATFQNPAGLQAIGGNYYSSSANSGNPVATKALAGGAGAIHGGALEGSNVEIAAEFVNLIQAQNGFQANARTIRVTNEMLNELTNLIS